MHELGTVFYVIREVEQVVEENHLTKVASVTLEIGEVSGHHSVLSDGLLAVGDPEIAVSERGGAEDRDRSRRDLLRGLQADISHGKIRKNMPAL